MAHRIVATGFRRTLAAGVLIACGVLRPAIATAADTLAHAKELYASAAYDEALAELERLEGAAAPGDAASIAEYRVFCLLALDRRDEARKNIEGILKDNPLYLPSSDQASPRIQNVFRDVRRQSLPKIVMERYADAKAAFERKDPQAGEQFESLLALMDDPDVQGAPALNDLRTVAQAFRDLTKAMAIAQAAPPPAAPAPPVAAPLPAPPPPPPADLIYTSADADVAPPVPQSQRIPPWMPVGKEAAQDFRGTLELVIDEKGAVMSATMRSSVHPAYNAQLIRAAKEWKFIPARRQGTPVRYLKIVEIHLKPTSS
jgi:hypothetical protein